MIVRGATTLGTAGDYYIVFKPDQIKSATGNRGTFDPSDPNILNQGETPRAQIALPEGFDAGPAIISLLQGADLTSFIHESGHLFLEIQADLAIKIQQQIAAGASVSEGERGIVADFNRLLDWFGIKGNESISPIEEWAGMTLEEFNAYQDLAGKATQNAIDELQVRTMKDMKWLSRARDKALKARQQEVEDLRREVRQEVRAEVMAEPVYRAWQFLTAKGDQGDTAQGEKASKGGAQIDLTRDNLFTVIAKHGGLNRDEVGLLTGDVTQNGEADVASQLETEPAPTSVNWTNWTSKSWRTR